MMAHPDPSHNKQNTRVGNLKNEATLLEPINVKSTSKLISEYFKLFYKDNIPKSTSPKITFINKVITITKESRTLRLKIVYSSGYYKPKTVA